MGRPVLHLWRYLLPLALTGPALIAMAAFAPWGSRLYQFAVAVVLVHVCWSGRAWWLPVMQGWRLVAAVRRFRTLPSGRIVLHYDPAVAGRYELPVLARQCGAELDRLAAWFGRPLRGRLAVYLFADPGDVARLLGPEYGGAAIPEANVALVAAGGRIRESLRHELAHLFAARWNLYAPPLLAEGLAVWLQGTDDGEPIDGAAWPWIGEPGLSVRALLDRRFFFAEPHRHACYRLAGSFTGFLLRRHGRAAYRRLYARASARTFAREFRRCLGVSPGDAEREWRDEVRRAGPLGQPPGLADSPWAAESAGAPDTESGIG